MRIWPPEESARIPSRTHVVPDAERICPTLNVPANWSKVPPKVAASESDQLPVPFRATLKNGEPPERIWFAAAPFIRTVELPGVKTPP
jgi:hypothetical protein